jgi:twitching motility protein PilU
MLRFFLGFIIGLLFASTSEAAVIKGVVAQRLLRNQKGKRVPALEIMLGTPEIREIIQRGKVDELKAVMEKSITDGMQSFDTALYNLWIGKQITREDALHFAESRTDLNLKMRLGDQSSSPDDVMKTTEKPADRFKSTF